MASLCQQTVTRPCRLLAKPRYRDDSQAITYHRLAPRPHGSTSTDPSAPLPPAKSSRFMKAKPSSAAASTDK